MKVVVRIRRDGKAIASYTPKTHAPGDLTEAIRLAMTEFLVDHPHVSLFDENVTIKLDKTE
ncbi:MAG: hypothetical protein ACR2O4_15880 [Hyphomicrobiaceae bacterium]